MPRRIWRNLLSVLALSAAAGVTALIWVRYDFEKVSLTWGVVGGVFGAFVVVRQVIKDRDAARGAPAEQRRAVADELAGQARRRVAEDAVLKTLEEPYPLPVRWVNAPEEHQPSWRTICRSSEGGRLDLSGRDDGILAAYRRIPSGRMLVLGIAGSGKSILVTRLARQLAADGAPDAPIPVLLYIASWEAATTRFDDWVVSQIAHRYPRLSLIHPRWRDALRELLHDNQILPILDGLDEMTEERAATCLRRLNEMPARPLVLTSRSSFYRRHLRRGEKLRAAAVIVIQPLDPVKVADYLADAAPFDQLARWRPVLAEMTGDGRTADGGGAAAADSAGGAAADGADGKQLASALSTPLMVALARLAFTQREIPEPARADTAEVGSAARDPGLLVELARSGGRQAVEDELINSAVEVAIPPYREGWLPGRWPLEKTRRYLSFLAEHLLEADDRREFVWWRLPEELPGAFWTLFTGVRAALAVWITLLLADDALRYVAAATDSGVLRDAVEFTIAHSGLIALSALLPGLALSGLRDEVDHDGVAPVRIAFRGGLSALAGGLVYGLFIGALWTAALWIGAQLYRPVTGIVTFLEPYALPLAPWPDDIRVAATLGLLRAGYVAVRIALRVDFSAPAAWFPVTEPIRVFRADRAATVLSPLPAVAKSVLFTVVLFAALAISGLLPAVPVESSALAGAGLGLGWWVLVRLGGAWPRSVVTRLLLALAGRLPYRLLEFLVAVESVGLLRDLGGRYRFRHERLQNLLARLGGGPRGARHREAYATELARAGYWDESREILGTLLDERSGHVGADELRAAALRKAVFTGCAAGRWQPTEELLLAVRTGYPNPEVPHAPSVTAKRREISELVRRDASPRRLLVACQELVEAETALGRPDPASREFLATLSYLGGDRTDRWAALAGLWGSARDPEHCRPVAAALLTRQALDEGKTRAAMAAADRELLWTTVSSRPADLARLAESWWWSVHTLAREAHRTARRPHTVDPLPLPGRPMTPRQARRMLWDDVETDVLRAFRAALRKQALRGPAVVVVRLLVETLRTPRRFRRVVDRAVDRVVDRGAGPV